MKTKTIDIADIKLNDNNPRAINPENLNVLKNSLKTFGQLETLIVDKDNNLISGHQRLSQLKELGEESVVVNVYDGDKPETLGVVVNHDEFEGEFDTNELLVMVGNLPNIPEFQGLEFDKTIRTGNAMVLGGDKVVFGGFTAPATAEEVARAELKLSTWDDMAGTLQEEMLGYLK